MVLTIPFEIGQKIKFKLEPEIEAIITGIIIRSIDMIAFECSYLQGGQHKICTVTMNEIESPNKQAETRIGFCACRENNATKL
jgi:hypothetical protein